MKEKKCDKTRRIHIPITVLGIVSLALLILVSIVGAATSAYVTNAEIDMKSGTVSVIDTATNTVIDTVKVGRGPVGVAFGHFTDSNAAGQSTNTATAKTISAGFNVLILTSFIILYFWKK